MVMLHGCTIGENSLIGIGAIILNRAVIGKNCLIGAGALVPEGKHIPDGSLVLGVPGKVVRHLTPEDIANNTWIAEHYVERVRGLPQGAEACRLTPPAIAGRSRSGRCSSPTRACTRSCPCACRRRMRSPSSCGRRCCWNSTWRSTRSPTCRWARSPASSCAASNAPRAARAKAVAWCAALSLAMEALQLFVPNRVASLYDVAANTAGAFAGTLVFAEPLHALVTHPLAQARERLVTARRLGRRRAGAGGAVAPRAAQSGAAVLRGRQHRRRRRSGARGFRRHRRVGRAVRGGLRALRVGRPQGAGRGAALDAAPAHGGAVVQVRHGLGDAEAAPVARAG